MTWSDLEHRTPAEISARRRAFRSHIAELAVEDRGICCPSASERVAALPERPRRQIDRWAPVIAEVLAGPALPEHPVLTIQKAVAKHYGVDLHEAMFSKCRLQELVRPRWVAVWLAKEMTRKSLSELGRRFGRKHHTSILHTLAEMEARLAADPVFAAEVAAIRAETEKEIQR